MAYRAASDDALEQQLLRQQARNSPLAPPPSGATGAAPTPPVNTTQPVGAPSALDTGANIGPWKSGLGPQPSGVTVPQSTTASPLAPMAGGAFARYGTGNLPDPVTSYGGEGMGQLEGFNTNQWGQNAPDYHENTIKNTFGKIASRYNVTKPGAVQQVLNDPDFKARFPEAKLVQGGKGDLIDFGDGNPVDVIRGANPDGSGQGWAWQPQNEAGGGGGEGLLGQTGTINPMQIMGQDPLAGIQSEIEKIVAGGGGGDTQSLIQRILRGEVKI